MSISLQFPLTVEDDWPPFGSESLPFEKSGQAYRCLAPPMFVKDLSVGDIIECELGLDGFLVHWSHISRSDRSTVWLLRLSESEQVQPVLQRLRDLGCNTAGIVECGCFTIDVPREVSIDRVDEILDDLDPDLVAVAFPSMRHPESASGDK